MVVFAAVSVAFDVVGCFCFVLPMSMSMLLLLLLMMILFFNVVQGVNSCRVSCVGQHVLRWLHSC